MKFVFLKYLINAKDKNKKILYYFQKCSVINLKQKKMFKGWFILLNIIINNKATVDNMLISDKLFQVKYLKFRNTVLTLWAYADLIAAAVT